MHGRIVAEEAPAHLVLGALSPHQVRAAVSGVVDARGDDAVAGEYFEGGREDLSKRIKAVVASGPRHRDLGPIRAHHLHTAVKQHVRGVLGSLVPMPHVEEGTPHADR